MNAKLIAGLAAVAAPGVMLLAAPSASAADVRIEAHGQLSDSVHAAWTADSLFAYPGGGAPIVRIAAHGIIRDADHRAYKIESWKAEPQLPR
jgi:hypothetical protein